MAESSEPTESSEANKPRDKDYSTAVVMRFIFLTMSVVGTLEMYFRTTPGWAGISLLFMAIGFFGGLISIFFKGKPRWPGVLAAVIPVVGIWVLIAALDAALSANS